MIDSKLTNQTVTDAPVRTVTIKISDNCRNRVVMPPTRRCMICEKLENPEANLIDGHGWICPSCAQKIGELIGVRTTKLYGDEL